MTNSEIVIEVKKLADKHAQDIVFTGETNYNLAFTSIANHIKELDVENDNLKSEVNRYKNLIEHRKEVSIINHNLYSDLECERDELLAEVEELKATISKMETITEKVFEETIGRWHSSDVNLRVYEYLGITYDEYKWWLEGGYQ